MDTKHTLRVKPLRAFLFVNNPESTIVFVSPSSLLEEFILTFSVLCPKMLILMRGRAVVARQAHNLEVLGSNPSPATINRSAFLGAFWFESHPFRGLRTPPLLQIEAPFGTFFILNLTLLRRFAGLTVDDVTYKNFSEILREL